MKFDCPHCGRDLEPRNPTFGDYFGRIKRFDCPHCGKSVKLRLYVQEFGAVVLLFLGIVLPIQYFAEELRGVSAWVILTILVLEIAVGVAALVYLVRNKQRYKK